MLYAANDTSAEAVAWRSRGDVQYAQRFLDTNPGWLHGRRAVDLGHTRIRLSDLAFGFEVGLGPVKHPVKVPAGIGVTSFGVYSEQSVTDAAMLHELLWRVQPSLVVEVGTMCGGSAIFLARTMMGYNPASRVLTFDLKRPEKQSGGRKCLQANQGFRSPQWKALQESGNLVSIVGDVTSPENMERIRGEARRANGTFVVDDASHVAAPTIRHFAALSRFVSVGGYYLVQDTRLDYDCALSVLTMKPDNVFWYCRRLLAEGGPAAAVEKIMANVTAEASSRGATNRGRAAGSRRRGRGAAEWIQDRDCEKWIITQHPGGYLRRVRPPPPAARLDDDVPAHTAPQRERRRS